jgi:four helix bundle protein
MGYDLEKRTLEFAKAVALFCKSLPGNTINFEYIKQVVRPSGSVGANDIEANEALSKKDFAHRIRIARKEAKETNYWLELLSSINDQQFRGKLENLSKESIELKKILSAILNKST